MYSVLGRNKSIVHLQAKKDAQKVVDALSLVNYNKALRVMAGLDIEDEKEEEEAK